MLLRLLIIALLFSTATYSQETAMSAKDFASLLPRISCDSIRLTRGPDDSVGTLPKAQGCAAIVAKNQFSPKQFWPAIVGKDSAETYIATASKKAVALCKALLNENGASNGSCTFDEANAKTPIYQAIVDQYAHGLVPDGAAIGSICTQWPLKPKTEASNAYVFGPIIEKAKSKSDWDALSIELANEGFVDSFGQRQSKTRFVWGISFEAGQSDAQLIAPQWFTIYNGPKSQGFALVRRCQTEGGQACADLQNLRNLGPDYGLCLESGTIGQ